MLEPGVWGQRGAGGTYLRLRGMPISGERAFRQREEQVQRPWGRGHGCVFEGP